MGGPEKPTISPEQLALQRQAEADRIDTIRDRTIADTRDLLIRFGTRAALSGSSGSSTPASSAPSSLGLFRSRQLGALRAFGRL